MWFIFVFVVFVMANADSWIGIGIIVFCAGYWMRPTLDQWWIKFNQKLDEWANV